MRWLVSLLILLGILFAGCIDIAGVSDESPGNSDSENTVMDYPPTASFDISLHSASVGDVIEFFDASMDDDSVTDWSWDFGDGHTSDQQNPSHSYNQAGTYTISLVVTDSSGQTDEESKEVEIEELQSSGTLVAKQNGKVTRNFPDDHRSMSGSFSIRSNDTGDEARSLLLFDLDVVNAPIESACLTLTRLDSGAEQRDVLIKAFQDTSWTEKSLTWNTMNHDAEGDLLASPSIGEYGYPPTYGIVHADVTDWVARHDGELVAFLIDASPDTLSIHFNGRTNPDPPTLSVNEGAC